MGVDSNDNAAASAGKDGDSRRQGAAIGGGPAGGVIAQPADSAPPGVTGFGRLPAALLASAVLVLPAVMSRPSSPSPDHPRVLLWYKMLRQPWFKPPDLAIPLAWTFIDSALAGAAYRLLRRPSDPGRNRSLAWLSINTVGIGGWSMLFFGKRDLPASTVAAAALGGAAVAYVAQARKTDKLAAAAGVPLVAWVAFATVLTAAIWRRNR